MAWKHSFFYFFNLYSVFFFTVSQGEKYLFLKKKYRQQLQERDNKKQGTEADGQISLIVPQTPASAQWEVTDTSTAPLQQKELQDELISCGEPESAAEVNFNICVWKQVVPLAAENTTLWICYQRGHTMFTVHGGMTHLYLNKAVFVSALCLFSLSMCQRSMTTLRRGYLHRRTLLNRGNKPFHWGKYKLAAMGRIGRSKGLSVYIKGGAL